MFEKQKREEKNLKKTKQKNEIIETPPRPSKLSLIIWGLVFSSWKQEKR